jgi:hypothetical protein
VNTISGIATSLFFFLFGLSVPSTMGESFRDLDSTANRKLEILKAEHAADTDNTTPSRWVSKVSLKTSSTESKTPPTELRFRHGDISWLPELAIQAGWHKDDIEMLGIIILRESGGCPNRRGGDMVDKNCNIVGVSEWNHRSDTGLLQINGLNYDISRNRWAAICREMGICAQEPLLDPLTNLKAGRLLFELLGWAPWDPCTWGKEFEHRCKKVKKSHNP